MPPFRTSDLALENFGLASPSHSDTVAECELSGFPVFRSSNDSGEYRTIISGRIWQESASVRRRLMHLCSDIITEHTHLCRRILFCGIGNPAIPSDSLGARTAERLIVTGEAPPSGFPSVFASVPGIMAHTGIDTAAYIRCLANEVKPDLIIAADALAAGSRERLQTVIQISTCGITPGSALAHTSGEISVRTMPCPVISIGVPSVISTAALTPDANDAEILFVSRADSDIITDCYASILSGALNHALFGK